MLPKNFRLRKRTEFSYSFKHGKFNSFKNFNLVIFKRNHFDAYFYAAEN